MYSSQDKILSLSNLLPKLAAWRVKGTQIVFTNGCFDLVHPGHLDYLEKAKALGDKLIVGLNADSSVKQLKGENRPIMDEQARAKLLAALEFIDAVVLFEEETPANLIQALMPDILVKGGDYEAETIVGYDVVTQNGGEVKILPFLEGYSSTSIIQKIKGL